VGWNSATIRPILFRSLDEEHPAFGVNPFPNPLACYIGAWDWVNISAMRRSKKAVGRLRVNLESSDAKLNAAMAKSGANYMNSQLIKMEALPQRLC